MPHSTWDTPFGRENSPLPTPSAPTTVYFDTHGDTRLLVNVEGVEKVFIVSAKTMTLACDVWSRMLSRDGYFKEAQPTASGMTEVSFPEDDAHALSILLNIAHLRFKEVPKTLSFRELLQVAILTDKYGATKLVGPWVKKWIEDNKHTINANHHEEWLWIAWKFGEEDIFNTVVEYLTRRAKAFGGSMFNPPVGRVFHPEDENPFMPPGILESILSIRQKTVHKLLEVCYTHTLKYSLDQWGCSKFQCRMRHDEEECDALIYGSMMKALQKIRLGTERPSSVTITFSITNLAAELCGLKILTLPQTGTHSKFHGSCSPLPAMQSAIADITCKIPSPVLDRHRTHIKKQHEILN